MSTVMPPITAIALSPPWPGVPIERPYQKIG